VVVSNLLRTITSGRTMQGNDKLLERMYCFKEVDEDTRMVIHVHTLVRWGDRAKLHPNSRARKVCLPPQIPCCASAPSPIPESHSSAERGFVSATVGSVAGAVGTADPSLNTPTFPPR
jgi:hypothetical protein